MQTKGYNYSVMETISVDGENYVKASSIARELGYTADYVGQLCRAGTVEAKMVGRSWYVNEDSLRGHKKGRYRSSAAKSKSEIHKTIAERTHSVPAKPNYLNYNTSYETDDNDLLPGTKPANKEERSDNVDVASQENEDAQNKDVYDEEQVTDEETKFVAVSEPKEKSVVKINREEAPTSVPIAVRKKVLPATKSQKSAPAVSARQNSLSTAVLPKPAPKSIFGPISLSVSTAVLALAIVGAMLSLEQQVVVSQSQVSSVIGFDYQQTLSDLNTLQNNVFSP